MTIELSTITFTEQDDIVPGLGMMSQYLIQVSLILMLATTE